MSKSIHDLGADFAGAALPTYSADQIPDEYRFVPPPQPQELELRLPTNCRTIWDRMDMKDKETGAVKAVRAVVIFGGDDPLTIVAAADPKLNGTVLPTIRITNAERNRSRKGEPEVLISDLVYLLRALGSTNPMPPTNQGYVEELAKFAARGFRAELEWGGYCNPDRPVYVEQVLPDGSTQVAKGLNGDGTEAVGCGKRHYQQNWPRLVDGSYAPRMTCSCGASLRPNLQLRNFKKTRL